MRRLCLLIGLLVLALIWLGPLLSSWRSSFASHMLAHMGVIAVAAPLLAIGLSSRLAVRMTNPGLPVVASLLELIAVWAWHAPSLRAAAENSIMVTAIEQASFLFAGLFLWLSSIGSAQGENLTTRAAGIGALLLTSIHMTLLGALLALSPRPLYGEGQVTCFGIVLDAHQDQEFGGVLMLLIGGAVYLAGGLVLLAKLLAGGEAAGKAAR